MMTPYERVKAARAAGRLTSADFIKNIFRKVPFLTKTSRAGIAIIYNVQNNFTRFLLTFLALSVILCLALKVTEC